MIDPTGTVIRLLAADLGVIAIAGARVRGGEPAQGDKPPLVVVSRMTTSRDPAGSSSRRIGLQEVFLGIKCYGVTKRQAAQLYGACSDALHMHAPLVDEEGRAIFSIADDVGTASGQDPGTGWPWEDTTVRVIAAAGSLP
jgi:hypothetical protein